MSDRRRPNSGVLLDCALWACRVSRRSADAAAQKRSCRRWPGPHASNTDARTVGHHGQQGAARPDAESLPARIDRQRSNCWIASTKLASPRCTPMTARWALSLSGWPAARPVRRRGPGRTGSRAGVARTAARARATGLAGSARDQPRASPHPNRAGGRTRKSRGATPSRPWSIAAATVNSWSTSTLTSPWRSSASRRSSSRTVRALASRHKPLRSRSSYALAQHSGQSSRRISARGVAPRRARNARTRRGIPGHPALG